MYYKFTFFGNFRIFKPAFQMVSNFFKLVSNGCVKISHVHYVHILHSKIYFLSSHDFKAKQSNTIAYYDMYLKIFEQVLFVIRFCTKYFITPSNVDIILEYYLG